MDTLYPNIHERFRTEGLCPICLMEMELTPRYSCRNEHTMCYRCKPYYHVCPTCQLPLDVEILHGRDSTENSPHTNAPPSSMQFMARPVSPYYDNHGPSAPAANDFLNHERRAGETSVPLQYPRLIPCAYSHLGCWVKVPEHLQILHESRCQFRPHLEEENLPTDLQHDDLVKCRYSEYGCKVRTVPWRTGIHESVCIYKDRFAAIDDISEGIASATIDNNDYSGDPEELVQCKFRQHGCMVKIPRRRKYMHEQKCNYKNYQGKLNDEFDYTEPYLDPEEPVECRWSENGCQVKPKRCRKDIHEEKCNYKMLMCTFGCGAMFIPAKRYVHERTCRFAN